MSQAAFENFFKITCVAAFGQFLESSQTYLEAGTIFLRRVSGRIFKINKCLIETSRSFLFNFLHSKEAKIFIKSESTLY
jgi:hypothetical protein